FAGDLKRVVDLRVHCSVSAPVSRQFFQPKNDPKPIVMPIDGEFAMASGPADSSPEPLRSLNQCGFESGKRRFCFCSIGDRSEVHQDCFSFAIFITVLVYSSKIQTR